MDQLQGATCFSSLAFLSGNHQIRIAEEDVQKTSFCTLQGVQFKVISSGLTNAPATFQRFMDPVFGSCLGRFVTLYIYDILIYSISRDEHIKNLRRVFELLKNARFDVKLSKCEIFKSEVSFLGRS